MHPIDQISTDLLRKKNDFRMFIYYYVTAWLQALFYFSEMNSYVVYSFVPRRTSGALYQRVTTSCV